MDAIPHLGLVFDSAAAAVRVYLKSTRYKWVENNVFLCMGVSQNARGNRSLVISMLVIHVLRYKILPLYCADVAYMQTNFEYQYFILFSHEM